MITKQNFTFQTYAEYNEETLMASEFTFKCVRVNVTYKNGSTIGSTMKSYEDYLGFIIRVKNNPNMLSYNVQPVEHSFDVQDYM